MRRTGPAASGGPQGRIRATVFRCREQGRRSARKQRSRRGCHAGTIDALSRTRAAVWCREHGRRGVSVAQPRVDKLVGGLRARPRRAERHPAGRGAGTRRSRSVRVAGPAAVPDRHCFRSLEDRGGGPQAYSTMPAVGIDSCSHGGAECVLKLLCLKRLPFQAKAYSAISALGMVFLSSCPASAWPEAVAAARRRPERVF